MARMIALDELLTKTPPKLTTIPGVFAQQRNLLDALDAVASNYILEHQTPTQVISTMVRERISAANT